MLNVWPKNVNQSPDSPRISQLECILVHDLVNIHLPVYETFKQYFNAAALQGKEQRYTIVSTPFNPTS